MIYVDTSSVLAELLGEPVQPKQALWSQPLISSRLLEYEVWVRLHAYGYGAQHGDRARQLIGRITLLELSPEVLERAMQPFPRPVRTLDALHLASVEYLRGRRVALSLSTLDARMREVAEQLGVPLA